MTDRDLAPAEARAEIEAFMGEGWIVWAGVQETPDDCPAILSVSAHDANGVISLWSLEPTYRAAVDALKQAWRDAVRPWCIEAAYIALTHDVVDYRGDDTDAPECIAAEAVARVLKEDSNG